MIAVDRSCYCVLCVLLCLALVFHHLGSHLQVLKSVVDFEMAANILLRCPCVGRQSRSLWNIMVGG